MDNTLPILFFLTLLTGFSLYLCLVNLHERRRCNRKLSRGLELLLLSKKLFVLTQQHRGLTNGFLNGDHLLRTQIRNVKSEINQAYGQLPNHIGWSEGKADLEKLNKRWSQIASEFEGKSAGRNFENHCELIALILNFIDDCAEHYALYELKDSQQNSMRYLWQDLLKGSESIGQLRAIGTGVAAAGECSSVDKIRLHYLQDTVSKMSHSATDSSSVVRLLSTVENEIAVDAPKMNAKAFFQQATLTLETSIKEFDQAVEWVAKERNFKLG